MIKELVNFHWWGDRAEAANRVLFKEGRFISADQVQAEPVEYLDAGGRVLTPGLIDAHAHLCPGGTEIGMEPALAMLTNGVAAAADAGSCGLANFQSMAALAVSNRVLVKSYVNLSPGGIYSARFHEELDPSLWDEESLLALWERYPSLVLGLKIRLSADAAGSRGEEILSRALDLARRLNTSLCVHTTNPAIPCGEILRALRPGDIFCHVYQGLGHTIADSREDLDAALLAQRRGVILDACHGKSNFSLVVAQKAMEAGVFPDVISSDMSVLAAYTPELGYGLPYVMSKFLAMGLSEEHVLRAVTSVPARVLGIQNLYGEIRPGKPAHFALFEERIGSFDFTDIHHHHLHGNRLLVPAAAFLRGRCVFHSPGFSWGSV